MEQLWEDNDDERIDDDDDEFDPLDDELEADDDLETWSTIRRYLPTDAGE